MKKILMYFSLISLVILFSSFTFVNKGSSFIVLDKRTNRILNGNNYNEQMLVASTAKILTAITVIENYDLDESITITKTDTLSVGSKVYLEENEIISRRNLLYALMLRSANDAASALSKNDSDKFVFLMNETAKKIGMTSSAFSNASGLDETSYNLSTAYDMALLASYASKNEIFLEIARARNYKAKTNKKVYCFINKHKLVYNNEAFLWGKTGYTTKSKRILVSNYLNNDVDAIIVTINDSNDWLHHERLAKDLDNYDFKTVIYKGVYDTKLDVAYYIYIKDDIIIPLKKNESINIIIKLYEKYGTINIYLNNELIYFNKCCIYNKNSFDSDIFFS